MIAWNGGKCPVDGDTLVRVKVNVWDEPCGPSKAKDWFLGARDWWQRHAEGLARIEAYAVVSAVWCKPPTSATSSMKALSNGCSSTRAATGSRHRWRSGDCRTWHAGRHEAGGAALSRKPCRGQSGFQFAW